MKENNPHILGTEKVGKLLLEYSIPAIIGMTLTSLYNIIDSVFIGHGVGAMAISGLAISFPLMNLLVAFCTRGRGGWRYHFFYPPGAEGYGRCREGAGKRNGALCDKFYFLRRHHPAVSGPDSVLLRGKP